MKLILMGTSDWVIPSFERLRQEHDIVAVFTRPPAPVGRKKILQKSAVHAWAQGAELKVITDIKEYNHKPDFIVVASYGVILKDNVLNSAPSVNIHPSLLPKYRGPSPMLTAILNGDKITGISLMQVISQLDAGDIYMVKNLDIDINDTNDSLEEKVSVMSADMLSEFFKNTSKYPAKPQIGDATYTKKFSSKDTDIDWSKTPQEIHNQVRSIGARTKIGKTDVKILETKISDDNRLEILHIQPSGKTQMAWRDFLNGNQWLKESGFNNVKI